MQQGSDWLTVANIAAVFIIMAIGIGLWLEIRRQRRLDEEPADATKSGEFVFAKYRTRVHHVTLGTECWLRQRTDKQVVLDVREKVASTWEQGDIVFLIVPFGDRTQHKITSIPNRGHSLTMVYLDGGTPSER